MEIMNVTVESFEKEVLQAEQTVLVDFWAAWCGPCKMVAPVIDQIAAEHEEIKVCKVNVDEQASLAMDYKVMSIPALMVFKNGQLVNKTMGVQSKSDIESLIFEV